MQPKPDRREVYQKFARIAQRYYVVEGNRFFPLRCFPIAPIYRVGSVLGVAA
jgi:hypothetical protein